MKQLRHYRCSIMSVFTQVLNYLTVVLLLLAVTGCFSTGRYSQRHDSAPQREQDNISTQNATPIFEPYNPANLRSYKVLGKRYHPLKTGKGYTATGEASWYGQKFHGHLTANGEIYNMYAMSAAHKTLPIPSYVQVTNLVNQTSAIVRINDRGPFHDARLIDLSYAAAKKLDILKTGTAKVRIDVIHIDQAGMQTVGNGATIPPTPTLPNTTQSPTLSIPTPSIPTPSPESPPATNPSELALAGTEPPQAKPPQNASANTAKSALYVQVTALSDEQKIARLAKGLATLYQLPTHTSVRNGLYRLRFGPLSNEQTARKLLNELKTSGYNSAYALFDVLQTSSN